MTEDRKVKGGKIPVSSSIVSARDCGNSRVSAGYLLHLVTLIGDSAIAVALNDPVRGIEMAIHDMQV
jgi:hypothetical protein